MNSRLQSSSPVEGLQLSLTAYKSLVSDYALRTRQAEDLCNKMMVANIDRDVLVNTVCAHIDARGLERSVQYLAIIQTTLMALTEIHKKSSSIAPEQLDFELLEIIKALTVATNPK